MKTIETIAATSRWLTGLLMAMVSVASLSTGAPAQAADVRFVPNAAGDEITDTQTGLIWRRCVEGQAWTGSTCGGFYATYSWNDALACAKSIATRTGMAWRLPNVKELQSLVNPNAIAPTIDTTVFPGTPSDVFWTSTPSSREASTVWIVHFYHGNVYNGSRYNGHAVRLVRAGQ